MLKKMDQLFSPTHIAVIGASSKNHWFNFIVINSNKVGFEGRIYPVNPNHGELCGIKTFKNIDELPNHIDLAMVMLNHKLALDAIKKLNEKGIKNIFLISSGYAETGEEGKNKQKQLHDYCKKNKILLIGPNCLGFINPLKKTSAFGGGGLVGTEIIPGKIGVIGQSGATSEAIARSLLEKYLGVSLLVTSGNEAVLTIEDYLEYLINDDATSVITGFIEGFKDIGRIKRLALLAAEKKIPIILLKIGRSKQGVKAAASHTGTLAGNDLVVDGFLKQCGVIRVDSIEELVDTAGIFTHCPVPSGDGLGLYIFSGGLCGMYADLCAKHGIRLPSLSDKTIQELRSILPEFALPDNPLDITGAADNDKYNAIVQLLMKDANLDIIVPFCMPPWNSNDAYAFIVNNAFINEYKSGDKPIIPISFIKMGDYALEYFRKNDVYYIDHPEQGFMAISHFINYGKFLRRFHALKEKQEKNYVFKKCD